MGVCRFHSVPVRLSYLLIMRPVDLLFLVEVAEAVVEEEASP
jgi:hypothetical protein